MSVREAYNSVRGAALTHVKYHYVLTDQTQTDRIPSGTKILADKRRREGWDERARVRGSAVGGAKYPLDTKCPWSASTALYMARAACLRALPPRAYLLTHALPSFLICATTCIERHNRSFCAMHVFALVAVLRRLHVGGVSCSMKFRVAACHLAADSNLCWNT